MSITSCSGPNLRVVREVELSASMTPLELFVAYIWPVVMAPRVRGGAKRTFDAYLHTLKRVDRFTDRASLADFLKAHTRAIVVTALRATLCTRGKRKGQPILPNTIRKELTHLQNVLDRAGPKRPRSRRDAQNAGLLEESPLLDRPRATRAVTKNVDTLAAVGQFIASTFAARSPRLPGCLASTWWRNLILVIYNCGVRIGTAVLLRRSWIEADEHGRWFVIPGEAMKMDQPVRVYINRHALAAINQMPIESDVIFPWPHTMQYLDACRKKLLARIGAAGKLCHGFNGVRKRANSEMIRINPAIAKIFAGHSTGDVNLTFYVDPGEVAAACEQLVQPPVPEVAPPPADDPQLWMF